MNDAPPTVNVSGFNAIFQVAERFGLSQETLTQTLQLEPEWLRHREDRLPVARYLDAFRVAAELCQCPDLGIYVGRANHFTGLTLLLYMSTICRSFREYLNLVPSILRLRGEIGAVLIDREGEFIRLKWQPLQEESAQERFLSDDVLTSSAAIVNSLCVDPIPVRRAEFTYAEPEDTELLRETFGDDLSFDMPLSCLYFDAKCLRSPIIKLDYELAGEVSDSLQDLFAAEPVTDPFLSTVRHAVHQALPTGDLHIDVIATELGVSRRTLQRRLAQRDTHFMQVLGEVRAELAVRYLADKRLGVTEIAFLLGYSDLAAFSTAFRGWYDCSPSEYRTRSA